MARPRSAPRSRAADASPSTLRGDLERLGPAVASALIPGLGQLIAGRRRRAAVFAIPFVLLVLALALFAVTRSPATLFATVVAPSVMTTLLVVNALTLVWRLAATLEAFVGRGVRGVGRTGIIGLVLILVFVALPHVVANAWGSSAAASFARIFTGDHATGDGRDGDPVAGIGPAPNARINVLIVGVDALPSRTENLTDSMMVASLDPVGRTASLVSIPRDLVGVPLGNGQSFGPKLNSLMSYAERHPKDFPRGGIRALEDAVGALLGIHVDYYARIDFIGFVKLVDEMGGIDIDVKKGFSDPQYDGYGFPNYSPIVAPRTWTITAGPHHFDGVTALAYARSRYAIGESDFTRAARQQEILLAIRSKLTHDGSLLLRLPQLVDAFAGLVSTDLPTDRLPAIVAVADELPASSIVRAVIKPPLVGPGNDPRYGSIQRPDLKAILGVAKLLFTEPATPPTPWPTPTPGPKATTAPRATAAPSG